MFDFLQTPEGLSLTAKVTAMLIAFAFLINFHPFKKETRLVIGNLSTGPWKPQKKDAELFWTAGDYFMYLNALLKASKTPDELHQAMVYVENYRDKPFRVPISTSDRNNYYDRLLDSYAQKELEFDCTKAELCKN